MNTMPVDNRSKLESVEELMLQAAELFHYSYKFRNQSIVLVTDNLDQLLSLLPDFKVLQSSHIRAAIFVATDSAGREKIASCNLKGYSFSVHQQSETESTTFFAKNTWDNSGLPVFITPPEATTQELCQQALDFCSSVLAIKFFYIQQAEGVLLNDVFLSHPPISELLENLAETPHCSISIPLLKFLCEQQQTRAIDIAIIGSSAGALFRELFTHRGSGTLLTATYPNIIRTATIDDISALSLLLTPYIQSGSILPVSEDQLVATIEQYHVFTVNGEIVAAACVRDYGIACELGKFCTLPRYQRKGRARLLALSLINRARELTKEYVFALSLEPSMWAFFLGLGFQECRYSELPENWLQQYDQSRGSRAFRLNLSVE